MPLKKITFKPGINRETTNYTNEGGWNDGDKIRFRAGFPEKIGGWVQQSFNRFVGTCRSLLSWVTLAGQKLTGVGTNEKFYLEYGNEFYDITPLRQESVGGITFTATPGSARLVVNDAAGHNAEVGDYVAFRNVLSLSTQEVQAPASITPPFFEVSTVIANWTQPTQGARFNFFTLPGTGGVLPPIIQLYNDSGLYVNLYHSSVPSPEFDVYNQPNPTTGYLPTNGGTGTSPFYFERLAVLGVDGDLDNYFNVSSVSSSTNTINLPSYNSFVAGMAGKLSFTGEPPAPLNEETYYYVLSSGTSSQISLEPGGTPIDILEDYTGGVSWRFNTGLSKDIINANGGYRIAKINSPTEFEIDMPSTAWPEDIALNGIVLTSAIAQYPIAGGAAINEPLTGYGAGGYSGGSYGTGLTGTQELRIWNQANFGEDLIFSYRGSPLYYWDADSSGGIEDRGVLLSSLAGASNVPVGQNKTLVSDVSRFVLCFGVNPIGSVTLDPMLIRWSDQENPSDWTPTATNQAGDIRLSLGSEIVTASQQRQEILVWTDAALYSLQYLGPPYVWGSQLVGENVTLMSPNAVASAGNVTYWMGIDKFYRYDGRVQTLRCDIRQYIFENSDPTLNVNLFQRDQVFAGTVEQFDEIWWFYCSSPDGDDPTAPDRYAVYNYAQDIWYYGTLERSAWLDSRINNVPLSAYRDRLILQETGTNDAYDGTNRGFDAFIKSSEFDVADGDSFMLITKVLPDVTFRGSTASSPYVNMSLTPMNNPGSGYLDPASVGGASSTNVTRTTTTPVEQFTGKAYVRVRGRQMIFEISSSGANTAWQLGSPRFEMRADGKRGGRFDA